MLIGAIEMRGSEQPKTKMTILVYDYVGIPDETLLRAEAEADLILRHAGIEVAWKHCSRAASLSNTECPDIGLLTPALRLMPRFRLVPNRLRVDTLGFSIGNMMTVSWEQADNLAQTGAAPVAEVLGVTIAHEFGHLLLGKRHSVSGIMRARFGLSDWDLAHLGWLVFLPSQATALRKELRNRSEILLAARDTP